MENGVRTGSGKPGPIGRSDPDMVSVGSGLGPDLGPIWIRPKFSNFVWPNTISAHVYSFNSQYSTRLLSPNNQPGPVQLTGSEPTFVISNPQILLSLFYLLFSIFYFFISFFHFLFFFLIFFFSGSLLLHRDFTVLHREPTVGTSFTASTTANAAGHYRNTCTGLLLRLSPKHSRRQTSGHRNKIVLDRPSTIH